MIEAMGMTEAGGAIFSNPLPPKIRKIGSPGIPYGFEVKIIDDSGVPVERNTVGEILLRGDSVMKRYHGDNADELVNGWLAPGAVGRQGADELVDGWLPTGDLGRAGR